MKASFPLIVILLSAFSPLSPRASDKLSDELTPAQEAGSLQNVDLAAIVLQPGDLPSGYSVGKTEHRDPGAFQKLPRTENVVSQQIKKKKKLIGSTTIFLYMNDEETSRAYAAMLKGLGDSSSPGSTIRNVKGIGERSVLAMSNMAFLVSGATVHRLEFRELFFVRCHAVINIRLDDPDTIISYAQKLDQRISASLCRSIGTAALTVQMNADQYQLSERIDKTITQEIDLTRDGKPEKIVLHVTGEDFKSPFTWTITIHSNGRKIFYKEHTDSERLDSVFNDPEFWSDCHDYTSCKSNWYFTDVMRLFFYTLKPFHLKLMQKKESWFTTFDEIKDLILKTGKATSVQANRIVEELKRDIENGKAICINPDVHPVTAGPIYLWIPIVDDFIFIYDD